MPDRVNHFAVWVAAIVYFLFGYLWYGLLFTSLWTSLMGGAIMREITSTGPPAP